jgi:hypothetical protein
VCSVPEPAKDVHEGGEHSGVMPIRSYHMHMNAAPPRDQRKTTRDYYSYVTYASLR